MHACVHGRPCPERTTIDLASLLSPQCLVHRPPPVRTCTVYCTSTLVSPLTDKRKRLLQTSINFALLACDLVSMHALPSGQVDQLPRGQSLSRLLCLFRLGAHGPFPACRRRTLACMHAPMIAAWNAGMQSDCSEQLCSLRRLWCFDSLKLKAVSGQSLHFSE